MDELPIRKRAYVLLVLTLIGLGVYWVGLRGAYYADDFKLVFSDPSSKIFYFFSHANPNSSFYRPIEWMIVASIQSFAGMNTLPIHLLILLCHVVLSLLVYVAAFKLTKSQTAASLSSGYMLLSQANAMAVLGNDMLSQVAGTLFGFISLWYFYRFYSTARNEYRPTRSYFISLLLFAVSLWFKETSVSFALALTFLALIADDQEWSRRVRKATYYLSPFYAVTIIYVLVHYLVVTRQAADRYQFVFGTNMITNLTMSVLSAFTPVSSVTTYVAYSQHHFISLLVIIMVTFAVVAVVFFGLFKNGLTQPGKMLAAIAIANLFPMVLFKHMGELYIYNSMPAVAILFAEGAKNFFESFLKNRGSKFIGILLVGLLFLSHSYADYSKSKLSIADGNRASELIKEIEPFVDQVPNNGTLILLNPETQNTQYSIFLMNGFNVLIYGTNIINQLSGRYDMHVWIVDEESRGSELIPPNALVLTLRAGRVQRVNP